MSDKKRFKAFIFDLDGTLASSHETIYITLIKTFEKLGVKANIPKEEFYKKIGWHFKDIFDFFNVRVNDIENFIVVYKNIYFDYLDRTVLYPSVEKVLAKLRHEAYKIALLTTKAQDQADRIIDAFNLRPYFNIVLGRTSGIPVKPSPEPFFYICKELKIEPPEAVMVGDSELDVQCGKRAGAKTCAVTFGYREKSFLELEKPDFIIDKFSDILQIAFI